MASILQKAVVPFAWYSRRLETDPLVTKSLTSGVMYAAGDAIAQTIEHYRDQSENRDRKKPFKIDEKRLITFFLYGTFVGGPLMHFWFGWLDTLPSIMYSLRKNKQRRDIMNAISLLKRYGIEINYDAGKIPQAKKLPKWINKSAKILMDQFVFSSSYTFIFFMTIGVGMGSWEKHEAKTLHDDVVKVESAIEYNKDAEHVSIPVPKTSLGISRANSLSHGVVSPFNVGIAEQDNEAISNLLSADEVKQSLEQELLALKKKYGTVSDERLDQVLSLLQEHEKAHPSLSWSDVVEKAWNTCKRQYVKTFIADCIVWPPLQLINFTFVPLKYQVLYVNVANLGWNTFLSIMANEPPH
jgi:hypothetical protein